MDLFPDAKALEDSGYLFRITDNGGETYDRLTITFCDGDYLLCTSGTICAHGESIGSIQRDADDVEAGTVRDLRWIDLDAGLQRRIIADLNMGFADYIEAAPAVATRDEARDWQGLWHEHGDDRTPIYCNPIIAGTFMIRDDERGADHGDGDPGPFATFRDAVFAMLPQDYDLAGPEYHTTVDLWSEEGGPAPAWDRETDPPMVDEHNEAARAAIKLDTGGDLEETIGWFANVRDAENFLAHSATIDPDDLQAGKYTIDDLDHPDAPTRR